MLHDPGGTGAEAAPFAGAPHGRPAPPAGDLHGRPAPPAGDLNRRPAPPAGDPNGRVAAAHARAAGRRDEQRRHFRLLRWGVILAVVVPTVTGRPAPTLHGKGLALSVCLAVFVLALMWRGPDRAWRLQVDVVVLLTMGAAGVALAALAPQGASELAVGATVLLAGLRLPRPWALAVAGAATAALAVAFSLTAGVSAQDVVASVLLCVVLGLVGVLLSQARLGQEQTEVLLARLEDARDAQAEAAAVAERGRIARELHDVLAHSLSGLAIQLEGARKLAERDGAGPELRAVVERAGALAKSGLSDARRAVDALRGGDVASVEHLPELVAHYHDDLGLPVRLAVHGAPRPLAADVSVVLYRAAGEALTNVVRHAPGSTTAVTVGWGPGEVQLVVDNQAAAGVAPVAPPGRGWGIAGIGERVALVGGRCAAGPTPTGWQVRVTVPA